MPETPKTDPAYITECLQRQAQAHVDASEGYLHLLEPGRPDQDPSVFLVAGKRQPADELEQLMNACYPLSSALIDQTATYAETLEDTEKALAEHKNVMLATTHNDLTDIAKALGAFSVVLERRGADFKTATITGKIVTYLGVELEGQIIPMTDVLRAGCDDLFLNLPKTTSTTDSGIPEQYMNLHNLRMLKPLIQLMRRGQVLWAIAPTASTRLKEVNPETVSLFTRKNVLVVPTSIWADEQMAFIEPEEPQIVNDSQETQAFMDRRTLRLNQHLGALNSPVNS
jgi:hypothetical protein